MPVKFINISREVFLNKYKRVYRFITVDRFIEMLDSNIFVFVNPSLWEDPFEKFFLEREFIINGTKVELPIKDKIFSVCVSNTVTSEAFWKVYAPKEDGIRLKFNTKNLINFLDSITNAEIYVGEVEYQKTEKFHRFPFNKNLELIKEIEEGVVGDQQIKLLLLKRNSFKYEDEIRIIVRPHILRDGKKLCKFPADITKFTTNCLLHPKIGKYHAKILKEYFRRRFPKKGILHSNLYSELESTPINLTP